MCLSRVTKVYDKPRRLKRPIVAWKELLWRPVGWRRGTYVDYPIYSLVGPVMPTRFSKGVWKQTKSRKWLGGHPFFNKRYRAGFHVYAAKPKHVASHNLYRVKVNGIIARGSQGGHRCIVASEIMVLGR